MNLQVIHASLSEMLSQFSYPQGQSIFNLGSFNHQSQGDESETLDIILQGFTPYHEEWEDSDEEQTQVINHEIELQDRAYDFLVNLDANRLLGVDESSLPNEVFKVLEYKETVCKQEAPTVWTNQVYDSVIIQGTDYTIYIRITQSGQY